MNTLYQHCNKCRKETNFKWIDSFTLECTQCAYRYKPSAKSVVEFAAETIETRNIHLDMDEANKLFNTIAGVAKIVEEEKIEKPLDVRGGVSIKLPPAGYQIKHTPIEVRKGPHVSFPDTNLRLFLQGDIMKDGGNKIQ